MDTLVDQEGMSNVSARMLDPWSPWPSAWGSNGARAFKFSPGAMGVPLGSVETVGLQGETQAVSFLTLLPPPPKPRSASSDHTHSTLTNLREARRATGTAAMVGHGQGVRRRNRG